MRLSKRSGMSTMIAGIAIIVVLVVAGVAGYYLGVSSAPTSTTGVTSTVTTTLGAGATATVTATTTVTATGSASAGNSAPQLSVLQADAVAAQKECGTQSTCLTVYSTVDPGDWAADMAPSFYQAFPWANSKINWVGPSAAQVTSMAISECQTNHVVGDLLVVTLGIVYPVINANCILDYNSPMAPLANATVASGGADPNGAWYVSFVSIPVIQYNTAQMKALNLPIPTQWSDLGNPVYKGHIAFQTATSLSATTGIFYNLYGQMGNSSWTTLMKAIAANQPIITASASTTTGDITAGTAALGIGLYNDYLAAIAAAPGSMGIVTPSPNVYNPGISAITKGSAHPAMAKLVEDWLMSNAGQQGYAETARTPVNPQIAAIFNLVPPKTTLVNSYSNTTIFKNPTVWTTLFKNIFGA